MLSKVCVFLLFSHKVRSDLYMNCLQHKNKFFKRSFGENNILAVKGTASQNSITKYNVNVDRQISSP